MIQSLKQFRKRHLSTDPAVTVLPLGPCWKASTVEQSPSHSLVKDADETEVAADDALSHAGLTENLDDEPVFKRHPMEPSEIDHPIRCPHPEPCIIQDGRALRERAPSIKRGGQLPFLTEQALQSSRWNRRTAPSDMQICQSTSAPEASFKPSLP